MITLQSRQTKSKKKGSGTHTPSKHFALCGIDTARKALEPMSSSEKKKDIIGASNVSKNDAPTENCTDQARTQVT